MIMWPEVGEWAEVDLGGEEEEGEDLIQGQVFQLDENLGIAILMEPLIPTDYYSLPAPLRPAIHHSVKIVSLAAVKSVRPSECKRGGEGNCDKHPHQEELKMPSIFTIKLDRLVRREQRNIRQRQIEFGRYAPIGTSKEAMAIFSALAKTYLLSLFYLLEFFRLPCHWYRHGEKNNPTTANDDNNNNSSIIVVMEEVYICSPYKSSSCRGTIKSNPALVERVKKVLEGERWRLGLEQ